MKKYALVGSGNRAEMYLNALAGDFRDAGQIVALCDTNSARMKFWNEHLKEKYGTPSIPCYRAADFERMISEQKPDAVIITSIDRTHHKYICRALELGCDAISEKPMTVDADKCQQIIDTVKRTGRKLTITFNYRYMPRFTKVKELVRNGAIGDVTSVHFEWLLDTCHGADYFRRWHRDKNNSGGLLVHKSTHHFDLVNWIMDTKPKSVFAMGDLKFYGRENAEKRGVGEFYSRARNNAVALKDPFALKITEKDKMLSGLYLDAEQEDGYYRDQSVFGDGISIEDNMGVIVRYENRAVMTYSLNAHCPYEGLRLCFNGTKGRIELNVVENPYCDPKIEDFNTFGLRGNAEVDRVNALPEIILQEHWKKAQVIAPDASGEGAHGGGDIRLLNNIFRGVKDDPLGHAAGYLDGAASILTGIAANISMRTGAPVNVADLVRF